MAWPLAEAKNRFSEVFEKALKEGPQHVTRRGRDRVVVVSADEYEKLKRNRRTQTKKPDEFVKFLLSLRGLGPLELPDRKLPARGAARRVGF